MNIDVVKDCLVIQKDKHGRFHSFEWIPHAKHTLEEVTERIGKWNNDALDNDFFEGRTIELITDNLVREICAYVYDKYINVPKPDAESVSDIINDAIGDMDNTIYELRGYMRKLKRLSDKD